MASEKFCLRWNDFETNINIAFKELRDDKHFFDVTLACEDEQIQAHKVILSACSPFFRAILLRNPHQHPLLYMQDVSYTDLLEVLDFMYHGEVNVAQEELNSFLALSEKLKVKGLTQSHNKAGPAQVPTHTKQDSKHKSAQFSQSKISSKQVKTNPTPNFGKIHAKTVAVEEDEIQEVMPIKSEPKDIPHHSPAATSLYSQIQPSNTLATADDQNLAYTEDIYDDYGEYPEEEHEQYQGVVGGEAGGFPTGNVGMQGQTFQDPSELLQFVEKDITDISKRRYGCTICNQFFHQNRSNVRNHVECKHFPNSFVYNCEHCGNSLPSKAALQKHKHKVHRPMY